MDGFTHCHEVLDNVLPPLQAQYGDQLQISLIEVSSMDDIERLYEVAARYGIPKEQVGVPFLIIGEQILIGSGQICGGYLCLCSDLFGHLQLCLPLGNRR